MFETWAEAAIYMEDVVGEYVDWEENFFYCPHCGEPIYEDDWLYHYFEDCPICRIPF